MVYSVLLLPVAMENGAHDIYFSELKMRSSLTKLLTSMFKEKMKMKIKNTNTSGAPNAHLLVVVLIFVVIVILLVRIVNEAALALREHRSSERQRTLPLDVGLREPIRLALPSLLLARSALRDSHHHHGVALRGDQRSAWPCRCNEKGSR